MLKLFKFDTSDSHYTLIGLGAFVRAAAIALIVSGKVFAINFVLIVGCNMLCF